MQDRQPPLDLFVGRAAERAQVAEVSPGRRQGSRGWWPSKAIPGSGRQPWRGAAWPGRASLRVLSARAGQAEADLEFGLVEQLLRAAGEAAHRSGPRARTGALVVRGRGAAAGGGGRAAGRGPLAILIDDLQWADRKSVEALTFMLRRLSVDPVMAVVTYRGPGDRLDEAAQRLLQSVENRLHLPLGGLSPDDVAPLAAASGRGALDADARGGCTRTPAGTRCTCGPC